MKFDLYKQTLATLLEQDPTTKVIATQSLKADWDADRLSWEDSDVPVEAIPVPGRPAKPELVPPLKVGRRGVNTIEGRAALIHSLAHIEFNAINLALDAVYRFRGMPKEFYSDWLHVAAEEAYHFTLLRDHLRSLGYDYGDFNAHNGLWEMAVKTAHDPLVRMALVPRVLEARGLDASPMIIRKLQSCGDARAVEILETIQRDEIGHVRIGNQWYAYLCQQRDVDPITTFRDLVREYGSPRLRGPFDLDARREAGFSERELELLEELAASK